MRPTYEQSWALLRRYNKEPFHLQHALTVSGVMEEMAKLLGYDEEKEFWSIVGLLHDLDFEMYPDEHCIKVQEIMLAEDIDAVSVKSLECTVFQMVDAQVAGEYGEALGLMQGVLDGGEDRMLVLSMLLRQYRMLYQLRCLMAERVPQSEFPSLLKIPPFAARRMQAQAVRYDQARLKAVYDFLLDFEYRIKSGKLPQDGCAEAALMQMKQLLEG